MTYKKTPDHKTNKDSLETIKGADPVAKGGDQQKLGNETVPGATSNADIVEGTNNDEDKTGPHEQKFTKFLRETHQVSDQDAKRIYKWFQENPK